MFRAFSILSTTIATVNTRGLQDTFTPPPNIPDDTSTFTPPTDDSGSFEPPADLVAILDQLEQQTITEDSTNTAVPDNSFTPPEDLVNTLEQKTEEKQ